MMTLEIRRLASDVATLLGESLAEECRPEESPFPGMEERVRLLAPAILSRLITETPVDSLGEGKPLLASPRINNEGVVTITLPDDFLRLIAVRMSDWDVCLSRIIREGDQHFDCLKSKRAAIRGTPRRPAASVSFDEEGRQCLRLYSSDLDASLLTARYMPLPEVSSDDTIDIPPLLYPPLIEAICQKVTPSVI